MTFLNSYYDYGALACHLARRLGAISIPLGGVGLLLTLC